MSGKTSGRTDVRIRAGSSRRFSIAAIPIAFSSDLSSSFCFGISRYFRLFESPSSRPEMVITIGSRPSLPLLADPVLVDSNLHWKLREGEGGLCYELSHPPSSRVVCRAAVRDGFEKANVVFDEETLRWLEGRRRATTVSLPYPLEQLLFVPALARRAGVLLHAAGAVVGGRAVVLAGHSGDGKTTICGQLAAEGAALLSDERVVLRLQEGAWVAYGTPWPGEGNVVSSARWPLGGVFLLRQSGQNRVVARRPSELAAELLSRSIVPYYLEEETSIIVEAVRSVVESVPVRILEFSLSGGILPLLSAAM